MWVFPSVAQILLQYCDSLKITSHIYSLWTMESQNRWTQITNQHEKENKLEGQGNKLKSPRMLVRTIRPQHFPCFPCTYSRPSSPPLRAPRTFPQKGLERWRSARHLQPGNKFPTECSVTWTVRAYVTLKRCDICCWFALGLNHLGSRKRGGRGVHITEEGRKAIECWNMWKCDSKASLLASFWKGLWCKSRLCCSGLRSSPPLKKRERRKERKKGNIVLWKRYISSPGIIVTFLLLLFVWSYWKTTCISWFIFCNIYTYHLVALSCL